MKKIFILSIRINKKYKSLINLFGVSKVYSLKNIEFTKVSPNYNSYNLSCMLCNTCWAWNQFSTFCSWEAAPRNLKQVKVSRSWFQCSIQSSNKIKKKLSGKIYTNIYMNKDNLSNSFYSWLKQNLNTKMVHIKRETDKEC